MSALHSIQADRFPFLPSPKHPPTTTSAGIPLVESPKRLVHARPHQRTSHACKRCQVLRVKCTGSVPCHRCIQDDISCGYEDRKRERNANLQQTLDAVVLENDVLRQQKQDILAILKVMRSDPRLDAEHVLGISELVQTYEAVAVVDPSTLPAISTKSLCERKRRCHTAKTSTGTLRPLEGASEKAPLVQAELQDDNHTGVSLRDDSSLCRKDSIEDTPDQNLAVNTNMEFEVQPLSSAQPDNHDLGAWSTRESQQPLVGAHDIITQCARLDPFFPWYSYTHSTTNYQSIVHPDDMYQT